MLGAAVGAIGSVVSGVMAMQQANYQAEVAKINAQTAVQEGNARAGATRDEYGEVASAQRVALAKAGVDINAGTSAALGLETQRRTEHAAAVEIWKGQTERTKWLNEAAAAKAEGKAALIGGVIGGVSGLVGGIQPGQSGSPLRLGQAAPPVTGTAVGGIAPPAQMARGKIPVSPWKPKNRGML